MALAFSLIDTWDDGKRVHVCGTVTASGNYTTGGDTLDLSQFPIVAADQPPAVFIKIGADARDEPTLEFLFTGDAQLLHHVCMILLGSECNRFLRCNAGSRCY